MTEEERQKQGPDMTAINIRICHNDNFMIADFFQIHISIANPGPNRCDQGSDFR